MSQARKKGGKVLHFLKQMEPTSRKRFKEWLKNSSSSNGMYWVKIVIAIEAGLSESDRLNSNKLNLLILPDHPIKTSPEKYIRVRLSQLLKKLFDFLALEAFEARPGLQSVLLFQRCTEIGENKYLADLYKRARKIISNPESAEEYQWLFQLETGMNDQLVSQSARPGGNHLSEVEKTLDQLFILQKLKYGCANLVESVLGAEHGSPRMMEGILEEVRIHYEDYSEVSRAYFHAYQMLDDIVIREVVSEKHYERFWELFQRLSMASASDIRDLFSYGQNYCVLHLRRGNASFRTNLTLLYDQAFEAEIFKEERFLAPVFYKNCIELYCKFGMLREAEDVRIKYQNKIHPKDREFVSIYNQAVIRFFEGDYNWVAKELYQILGNSRFLAYRLGARTYLCRALWKGGQYELLLDVLHSFTQFVFRNKEEMPDTGRNYRAFIRYLSRMAKAMLGPPDKVALQLERIGGELEKKEEANQYGWLRRQLQIQDSILA